MKNLVLSDDLLLKAYNQAKKMNLDEEFITMLEKEIEYRNLSKMSKTPDV